jgi:hypothetical protein
VVQEGRAMIPLKRLGQRRASIFARVERALHEFEFASGALGFLFGLFLMTCDAWPWWLPANDPRVVFVRTPEAMVWIFLVAAELGFWLNAVPFEWRWRTRVREEFGLHVSPEIRMKYALALPLFAAPAVLIARTLPVSHLAHQHWKVLIINLTGVAVALVPVGGIWFVRAAIDQRFPWEKSPAANPNPDQTKVKDILFLRRSLEHFIVFLGAMIGLGTLAKGASRHTFVATGGSPSDFPPEFILLHGAFFTGLLALVYIPTYTRLNAAGSELLDSLFPLSAPEFDVKKVSEWQANRKSLEELLQVKSDPLQNLRASVAILTPLASSTISILLGDKIMLGTK